MSFSSPSYAHDPFLHVARTAPLTGHPHVCWGFAFPSADPHEHIFTLFHIAYSTLFSHVLLHPLGTFLLVVSLADLQFFQVLLPSALKPAPWSPCWLFCSGCLLSPHSLTHSPFLMLGSTLPEAAFCGMWQRLQPIPCSQRSYLCFSETSSLGREVTNFLAKNS